MTPVRTAGEVTVSVKGTDLPAALYGDLLDARVEQSVQLPDRFTLRFRDPFFEHFDDASQFAIGSAVAVTFHDGQNQAIVTQSEITSTAIESGADGRHELVVSGLGLGHRLARGSEALTYVNQTDSQVASQIASRFNLTPDVDQSTIVHPYLLQSGTAYQFLTERAVRSGFRWWVSDGTLHFKNATTDPVPPLVWGANLQRFRARCSAVEVADDVQVRGWDPNQQQVLKGSAVLPTDLASLGSDAPAAQQLASEAKSSGAFSGHRFSGAIPVDDTTQANSLATALALRAAGQHFHARGQAIGNPLLRAGGTVKVSGVGTRLTGSYLLASVEHIVGTTQPYVTRFDVGGHDPGGLADLLGGSGVANRLDATVAGWNGTGLVVGVVTNVKDAEGFGRVKVRFPTLSDADESAWARVAATGAGKSRGFQIPFEVNDEVLVGFEHGDLRRPIIVGGLWSGSNTIPRSGNAAMDDQGTVCSVWQSKSGHIVELSDGTAPAKNHILASLADTKTQLLLAGDQVTLTTPNTFMATADQGVTITTKGTLTLDATNIVIQAKAKATVQGAQIESTANATLKMSGAQTEISGQAILKLEGGAMTEIKGGIIKLN